MKKPGVCVRADGGVDTSGQDTMKWKVRCGRSLSLWWLYSTLLVC